MIEIPGAEAIVESQLLDTLAEVKQQIAGGITVNFKEAYEPPADSDVSYSCEARVQLLGAYAKGPKIAVLAWVTNWDFPEDAMDEFWNKLCEKLYEEMRKRIPDLKWSSLEIHLLDSMEHLEKAAFLIVDFP